MPILFEDHETAADDFVRQLFWENATPAIVFEEAAAEEAAAEETAAPSLEGAGVAIPAPAVVGEGAPSDDTAAVPAPAPPAPKRMVAVMEWTPRATADPDYPLGMQLVHCTMAALFLPDLTVDRAQYELFVAKLASFRPAAAAAATPAAAPASGNGGTAALPPSGAAPPAPGSEAAPAPAVVPDEANAVWPMLLWHGGVGFPALQPPWNAAWNAVRVDLLRLLLALTSQPLYSPPSPQRPARSAFLDELVSSGCPFAPTLFYCLLNSVASYDPVGWGVPYATALVGDRDEGLVNAAVQVLLVLLDYAPIVEGEEGTSSSSSSTALVLTDGGGGAVAPAQPPPPSFFAQFNMYRSMLAGLTDPSDFDVLFSSIARLLGSVPKADAAMLPFALHQASCYQELLVLLWKLCDENGAFLQHVLTECDVTAVGGVVAPGVGVGRGSVHRVCEVALGLLVSGRSE